LDEEYNGNYVISSFYSTYASGNYFRNTAIDTGYNDQTNGTSILEILSDGLQYRSNCYGYVFRFYCDEDRNEDNRYTQQPGEFADKSGNGYTISFVVDSFPVNETLKNHHDVEIFISAYVNNINLTENVRTAAMLALMQADAEELGYEVTEYTGLSIPTASYDHSKRLIAVVFSSAGYHLYMQHSDNTWSHKDGGHEPTNLCSCHNEPLLNSTIRACAVSGRYGTGFVKFFYTTKSVADTMHEAGDSDDCSKTETTPVE
jgi:hypothetical protein